MELEALNSLHIEDIKNENHPSAFFETEEYKVLIFRFFRDKNLILMFSL